MNKWAELGQKLGISFIKIDGSFKPINEWLDDLYLQYTKEQAVEIIKYIYDHADVLFEDMTYLRRK